MRLRTTPASLLRMGWGASAQLQWIVRLPGLLGAQALGESFRELQQALSQGNRADGSGTCLVEHDDLGVCPELDLGWGEQGSQPKFTPLFKGSEAMFCGGQVAHVVIAPSRRAGRGAGCPGLPGEAVEGGSVPPDRELFPCCIRACEQLRRGQE